jgi:hypothetical protein
MKERVDKKHTIVSGQGDWRNVGREAMDATGTVVDEKHGER